MRLSILILLIMAGLSRPLRGQVQDSARSEVRDQLENALETFDSSDPAFSTEQLTQILQDLASNPININQAGTARLMSVPGINIKLAKAIVGYRNSVKPFERVAELVKVPGIGPSALDRIRPYVTVGSGLELGKALYTDYRYWSSGGEFEAFSRYRQTLQHTAGYREADSLGGYLGTPVQYYQRFRYRSDHVSVNLTQQKDAGEPFAGQTGFDYTSWHIALENNGKLQELVAGDYALYFGQGLVLWNGRTFGKGRNVIGTVNRDGRGVRPYASSQESDFFRGVAATYGGELQLTGFYSYRKHSASMITENVSRGTLEDGYHRTNMERAQRNNLRQKVWGGRLRMALPFGFVGVTGYQTSFDKLVSGTSRYDFSGQHTSVLGIDYTLLAGPAILYGEAARSQNGGLGFVAGLQTPLGPGTELTVAYRNYAKDFQSILGSGFGERSGEPQNEKGVYIGLRHALNKNITLSAYFDQYKFPGPRFGTSQPTRGHDWLGLMEVAFSDNLKLYVQARSETEDEEYELTDEFGRTQIRLDKARRSTLRAQFEYQVNPNIRLRTRGEVVRSRQAGEKTGYGYLMYQDIRYTPAERWSFDARITYFDTDSFDTRLYQFENDLLYVLSNEVLYNQGQRLYVLANYEPWSYLEIWAKFGITIFENERVIGSGLNQIKGSRRSDLGLQIRLKI